MRFMIAGLAVNTMKRFSITLFALVFVGSGAHAPAATPQQGPVGIAGRVSKSLKLSLGQGWHTATIPGVDATVYSADLGTLLVVLSGGGPSSATQITLPLEIRTNVAYDGKLTSATSDGCAPNIVASIGSARASGRSVTPGAANLSHLPGPIDVARCVNPITLINGPRVSTAGNFTTPGNALLVDLNLSIPENQNQCHWRVTIRISLHPAS